jgi:hypothetical protein
MNLADLNVNWNDYEDSDFKPLPEGTYAAKVTKSELKNTKSGDGQYIKIEFTLLGEKGIKDRKVFENFNIKSKNPEAAKIGFTKLKALIKAAGLGPDSVTDTSEIHGIPVGIKLKIKSDPEYGDSNAVKAFVEFSEDLLVQD